MQKKQNNTKSKYIPFILTLSLDSRRRHKNASGAEGPRNRGQSHFFRGGQLERQQGKEQRRSGGIPGEQAETP